MSPEKVGKEYGEFDFVRGLNEKQPIYEHVFDFGVKDTSGKHPSDRKDFISQKGKAAVLLQY